MQKHSKNTALTVRVKQASPETRAPEQKKLKPPTGHASERNQQLLDELPQVQFIARCIHSRLPQHIEVEDLVNAGFLGLIDAQAKYDSNKRVMFKSYAQFRIRGAILDHLRQLDWSPRNLRRNAKRIDAAQRKLSGELGRNGTDEEISAEIGMNLHEYQLVLGDLRNLDVSSLQEERGEDSSGDGLDTYISEPAFPDPFLLCLHGEMKELLAKTLTELPPRLKQLVALYYFQELTMKQIGSVLGVVESRISQMHSEVLSRMGSRMREVLESKVKKSPPSSAPGVAEIPLLAS